MHIHLHTHIVMYIYIHTYTSIDIYTHTYIHACMHYITLHYITLIPTYVRTYVRTYVHTYIYPSIHPSNHACIHTYIYVYIHTHVIYIYSCVYVNYLVYVRAYVWRIFRKSTIIMWHDGRYMDPWGCHKPQIWSKSRHCFRTELWWMVPFFLLSQTSNGIVN